ncbi:MAG TPA: hypothetical protein DCY13_13530 [Verrucomicrobiales bacterium]|nr:hypothetical protein [Verrucomicrobiales bacterium]
MKKAALTFLLAVLVPSLVLGWLALRSLRDQQLVAERQQTLLFQAAVDRLAALVNEQLLEHRRQFAREVEELLAQRPASETATEFHALLTGKWPLAEVGFAVSLNGEVMAPTVFDGLAAREFRIANDMFLCSKETVEVYYNTPKGAISLTQLDRKEQKLGALATATPGLATAGTGSEVSSAGKITKWSVTEAEFQQLVANRQEGTLARFLQDRLHVMFWYRSPRQSNLVFGSQVHLGRLVEDFRNTIAVPAGHEGTMAVALLNDRSRPLARDPQEFETEWRKPVASVELSESLPHWEITAYQLNPGGLPAAARSTGWTLALLTALLLLAIVIGGGLMVIDVRRQLAFARQKTDFVSNVSHELKTPLTSIRMFAELLAEREDLPADRRRSYVGIIGSETARLTRLINNVLDFARMERGDRKYAFQTADLREIVDSAVDSCRPALEEAGFDVTVTAPDSPVATRVDRDAIAQIVLNLISNAEKYSDRNKSILVDVRRNGHCTELRVMDRGLGVPAGHEERIFEQFHRAHDSLASGIQGSGLGLTLARQIARAHGGSLRCEAREGGGSTFILELPLESEGSKGSPT